MRLERFDTYRKYKKAIFSITLLLTGIIIGLVLYRSFAYYEETKTFNILEGRVPVINKGDVKIAVLVDNKSESTFPEKENHKYIGYECTNDAIIAWNDENWKLTLDSANPTVCTLKFVSISYVYKVGETIVDELPTKKGHQYKSYTCTNGATLEWDKKNWVPTSVSYTNTSVCTISFEIGYGLSGNMVEALKDSEELTEITHTSNPTQTGLKTQTDYRYVGAEVNNYVLFNDELWRIIGVFNTDNGSGTYQERVKLIRATGIGDIAWDSGRSSDWNKASLKTLLNGDYLNQIKESSYETIGLNNTARNQIDSVKWYLGAYETYNITAEQFFGYEQGGIKGSGASATSWTGKVGLMYPSDYGFSSDGSDCLSVSLGIYNETCASDSWIYKGNFNDSNTSVIANTPTTAWTLTPFSTYAGFAFYVNSSGSVDNSQYRGYTTYTYAIRPCVYLKHNIEVIDGTGEKNNPYELSEN